MEMTLSVEDYATQITKADLADCDECGKTSLIEEMIESDDKIFCDAKCRARHFAPLIKPQPSRTLWDGWDV